MTEIPTLHQIRFSHFNEKARWALDFKRIPHRRRIHLPAWHVATAMRMTRDRTMPILEIDGDVIGDSAAIIDRLEARNPGPALYPEDPAERERALELQAYLGEELGPHARRIFFQYMLDEEPRELCRTFTGPVGAPARTVYSATFPLTRFGMRRAMNIRPEATARSVEHVDAALDRIEAELDGGDYLVGDRFSVADLTAAALLFPLARPPEYQYDYPARTAPGLVAFQESLADRRAITWTREMWTRHRGGSAEVSV